MKHVLARIVLLVIAAALAWGVSLTPAQADGGDHRPCVTQREYWEVERGWRQARVAQHFDIPGYRIGYSNSNGSIDTVWQYRKCGPWGPGGKFVGIAYDNYSFWDWYMRLWAKVPSNPHQLMYLIG